MTGDSSATLDALAGYGERRAYRCCQCQHEWRAPDYWYRSECPRCQSIYFEWTNYDRFLRSAARTAEFKLVSGLLILDSVHAAANVAAQLRNWGRGPVAV